VCGTDVFIVLYLCCVASAQQVTAQSVDNNSRNMPLEDDSSDGEFGYFSTFWIF